MNQNQLQHFRGNEEFVKRLYDLIDQMQRYRRICITPFFTPEEASIAQSICGKQILYRMDGGYPNAERVRFAFLPYDDEEPLFPTICLKANYSSSFSKLSHPDILGAIMHIGIERDMIGDFIIEDDKIYIFCDEMVENYITCNLTKIKRCTLHFQRTNETIQHEQKLKYETKIVSSLRLDVMVSTLGHMSRSKATELIKAGLVKVNHTVNQQASTMVCAGSVISIRKAGRFKFLEVSNKTKKDHLVIEIAKYE